MEFRTTNGVRVLRELVGRLTNEVVDDDIEGLVEKKGFESEVVGGAKAIAGRRKCRERVC